MPEELILEGEVKRQLLSPGSKSEREAICLQIPGHLYVLRRSGGHPFSDPLLDTLAGKRIRARGSLHDTLFIMSSYEVLQ